MAIVTKSTAPSLDTPSYRVGILGATGMVGQRFVMRLASHPWFHITVVAASPSSAGRSYREAVAGRWHMDGSIPVRIADLTVRSVIDERATIVQDVDMVFCALDLDKATIQQIEDSYAAAGVAVISNNSAHRWTPDVPMLIPEVNPNHCQMIDIQRRQRGWTTGLIAVKPNCSIQSYVTILTALAAYQPVEVAITSLQAISGAGKTFSTWPEMVDNVIPYIGGEEEKSEREPLKIWGKIDADELVTATEPVITATCIRVPVSDGHMASVRVRFETAVTRDQIMAALRDYPNPLAGLKLPSAPDELIVYRDEDDRPQTGLDRDREHGMGITMGRLREIDPHTWQFIALSHNTIRGAAGGAVLMAELLAQRGFIATT